jgi:hypothetical protein
LFTFEAAHAHTQLAYGTKDSLFNGADVGPDFFGNFPKAPLLEVFEDKANPFELTQVSHRG